MSLHALCNTGRAVNNFFRLVTFQLSQCLCAIDTILTVAPPYLPYQLHTFSYLESFTK